MQMFFHLQGLASVFQAETFAIMFDKISELTANCKRALIAVGLNNTVSFMWIPGHRELAGNEKADELARIGSEMSTTPEEVRPPLNSMKHEIHKLHVTKAYERWKTHVECKTAKQTWPEYNKKRTEELLSKSRTDIARLTATLTRHWQIRTHAMKTRLPYNQHFRSCKDPQAAETTNICSATVQPKAEAHTDGSGTRTIFTGRCQSHRTRSNPKLPESQQVDLGSLGQLDIISISHIS